MENGFVKRSVGRGGALIYAAIGMPVVLAFGIFAVDYGRVQVAKTEIQAATDAAARAAGQKMIDGGDIPQILAAAVGAASQNRVDGSPVKVKASDLAIGVFDPTTKTFAPTHNPNLANAIRVNLTYRFGVDGPALTFAQQAKGGIQSVAHRATVMVDDPPEGWDEMITKIKHYRFSKTDDEIVTEESITETWRRIQEEEERVRRIEEERVRRIEEREARELRERDEQERKNPWLKDERLKREREERERWEREEREREERERWEREERKNRETKEKKGEEKEESWEEERREEKKKDEKPKKRVTQVE
jgi:Putative Flp pilus-assembly TadE/G-like